MSTPSKMPLILPCDGTDELPFPASPLRLPDPGTRWLNVGRHLLPLSGIVANELLKSRMIFDAAEGDEPERLTLCSAGPRMEGWSSEDVARLVCVLLGLGADVQV